MAAPLSVKFATLVKVPPTAVAPPMMGFWTTVSLVMGTIVGAGAFLLPSVIAQYGAAGLLGWAVSGLGAVALAMNFARMSQRVTGVGGPYHYVKSTLGSWAAFQIAVGFMIRGTVTLAALTLVSVSYLACVFPALQHSLVLKNALACGLILALMLVNYFGLRPVALVLMVSTVLKLIPLCFMAFIGIWFIDKSVLSFATLPEGVSLGQAVMASASMTFFSLMGMESATVPAADVRDPLKTIPRATLMGACAVVILYLLSATAVMGIASPHALMTTDAPYSMALESLFGPSSAAWVRPTMALFILVSCLGAMNAHMLTLTKLPEAAARDELFPRMLAKTNVHGTPWIGLLLSGLGACLLITMTASERLSTQFETVISISCLLGLMIYAMSSFTEIFMSYSDPSRPLPKPPVLGFVTSLSAFGFCLWAMSGISQKLGFVCLLVIFGMLPLYALSRVRLAPKTQGTFNNK